MAGLRDEGEFIALCGIVDHPLAANSRAPRFVHLFTALPEGDLYVGSPSPVGADAGGPLPGEPPFVVLGYMPQPVQYGDGVSATQHGFDYDVEGSDGHLGTFVNTQAFAFTGMPACTVVGWGLSGRYPSGYSLLLTGVFQEALVVPEGGTVVIPPGALRITAD